MFSTILHFKTLHKNLPPLFPEATKQKFAVALVDAEQKQTVDEVEDLLVNFGYEIWPWNEAYREFLKSVEGRVGEHFFLPRLQSKTKERYEEFKKYGGNLGELHSGRPANFFPAEDRAGLVSALIDVQKELRNFTNQEVVSTEKDRYLKRVGEFTEIVKSVEQILSYLKKTAKAEENHPNLANEIHSKVRGFEHSLCHLGPALDRHDVANSVEFFEGRRAELNRLRGIHTPVFVNFE